MRAMRRWQLAMMALCVSAAMPAMAKMQQRPVEWQVDGVNYSGVLVYDDAGDAKRPGVVMVPNWRGVNASAIDKAAKIAGDDYVVLVADVYGSHVRPKDNAEAGAAAQPLLKDRATLRVRARAALEALQAQAGSAPLDAARIGAVGFCFGGSTVLEMARAGMPLAGVVSLHGGLVSPLPAQDGKVPMLVLNGAADKAVSAEDIAGFGKEMDAAGADWQFVNFSGAVHCFAEADAGNDPASNCRYDARAAKRAWTMLDNFLEERLDD